MADDMHATGTRAAKTIWCPECGALPPHHANTCSHRPADAIPNSSTEASFSSGDPSERETPEPLGADDYPEVDDYGRRFRWEANYSTGKHVRVYAPDDGGERCA